MENERARVLDTFPYPVAYPYSLIFAEKEKPSIRRWALCFTEYQVLRMVCLPLVSQYLREAITEHAQNSIAALNRAIAAIRCPFFHDWISLVHTLRRHLPQVGLKPVFSRLGEALDALKEDKERLIGLRGQTRLAPLEAILALRDTVAHGALPDEAEATRHLETYLPVLHQILSAFDFLGDYTLKVNCDRPEAIAAGRARIRTLQGARLREAVEEGLSDTLSAALEESGTVLVAPDGRAVPLFPLFNPLPEREPLFLYDGHYGIRVGAKQTVERSYIYYLGVHHRTEDTAAVERLKELLAARQISFFLKKEQTAPWTIADSAADYSRRILEDLIGTKYFPECYVPFPDLERHFERFLKVPDPDVWPTDTARLRYVNGFVLTGLAGAGKTAFLARQVAALLEQPSVQIDRENPNLVLFLRGDGIAIRPEGLSLFHDVTEKLGIAVEGAPSKKDKKESDRGFSSFRELLDHLHSRWKEDRVPGRRFILVLDALNEAPYTEQVVREALDIVREAARYPWLKMVLSTRHEWLSIWSEKLGAQEKGPLADLRPFLYVIDTSRDTGSHSPPVVTLEPFTEEQAGAVYVRYQGEARKRENNPDPYRIPACQTPWVELPIETRDLLKNPLHLHLFMEAFDGHSADAVGTASALFRRYVDHSLQERPGLGRAVEAVMAHLLEDVSRPGANLTDDEANALRRAWAEGLSIEEARLSLSPVEALAHEGFMRKRVREEGGGYRFIFQTVAEYLIYRCLTVARSHDETELAYWVWRAVPTEVFPEYAGAFGFLLRDWAAHGNLGQAAQLVEASPSWLHGVLTTFLVEQAGVNHRPGEGSSAAEVAARTLAEAGSEKCTEALYNASYQLMWTRFAPTATKYLRACVAARDKLWIVDQKNDTRAYGLARALTQLALSVSDTDRVGEAEPLLRRTIAIDEALWAAYPKIAQIGADLGAALRDLGHLLYKTGRMDEAEQICRRVIRIYNSLWAANPEDVWLGRTLSAALCDLGPLLFRKGRLDEAEQALRQAIGICNSLWAANPEDVWLRCTLSAALSNLGLALSQKGRLDEAEQTFRQAIGICGSLWAANPEDVRTGYEMGFGLQALGLLLRKTGRAGEAEQTFCRSIEIHKALSMAHPEDIKIKADYAGSLYLIGHFAEAEQLVNEVLGQVPQHPVASSIRRHLEVKRAEEKAEQRGFWSKLWTGLRRSE
jgi:tetratricopeptide (TPR) repeat protein